MKKAEILKLFHMIDAWMVMANEHIDKLYAKIAVLEAKLERKKDNY